MYQFKKMVLLLLIQKIQYNLKRLGPLMAYIVWDWWLHLQSLFL